MTTDTAINVIALLLTAGSMIVAAVWFISRMKTDTALLRASLDHLTAGVTALTIKIDHLDKRVSDNEARIIRLETERKPARPRN